MAPVTPAPIPTLSGAVNFRPIGGYPAADGRKVRANTLYRSGTMHALTAEDLAELERLGIRYAIDFRSNSERQRHPSRLAGIAALSYWFRDHDHIAGDLKKLLEGPDAGAKRSRDLMIDSYKRLPYDLEQAYRALFAHLVKGQFPLVFSCTAGKDRTGVAAALVLAALRVPRDLILEDYLLSEGSFDQSCAHFISELGTEYFARLDRGVWEPLLRVNADYLNAMFDAVHQTHGTVERYLEERLDVGRQELERLRVNLLE
jgi:protein-tyrosine phosphatase